MKYKKKIHPMKKRKLLKMFRKSLAYILNYILPIIVLLIGLYITYQLLIQYGYNHETQMWNINNAFCYSMVGLGSTIVITFIVSKILRKIADWVEFK